MTDSSAWLIWDGLRPPARARLLDELFGPRGAHLGFLRLPLGASDFTVSPTPYTYDDVPPGQADPRLAHFSVAHDTAYILPALRAARALNRRLYVEGLPWSAPAWMKRNDALDNLGRRGELAPSMFSPFARYLAKSLRAYAAAGVSISAVAPVNEPRVAVPYPSMNLGDAAEAHFIRDYLHPALGAAGLHPQVFGWDLSWGPLPSAHPLVAAARSSRGRETGLAWHCYFGSPGDMSTVHREAPGALQIVDECSEPQPAPTPEMIIASLRNWAGAVALWNLALDPRGGPTGRFNGCPGCVGLATVDRQRGTFTTRLDLAVLGQFSRFISPGAVRVGSPASARYELTGRRQFVATPGLDDVAFRNPDGSHVLVAYNGTRRPLTLRLMWRGSWAFYRLPAGATATFSWR